MERIYSKEIKRRSFTIYCGSHSSETMFRIYDKKAEQKAFDLEHWLRFEVQLRRDRADIFIKLLLDNQDLQSLYAGVIKNYLRFVEPSETDTNLSRAKLHNIGLIFLVRLTVYLCLLQILTTQKQVLSVM